MFLMIGINPGMREIAYDRVFICDNCGAYGRFKVTLTYMCLALFFIPVFKWNREYHVESTCCGTQYILDPEIGRRLERGEEVEIRPEYLTPVGKRSSGGWRRCGSCGYATEEDFDFCPKCGQRF